MDIVARYYPNKNFLKQVRNFCNQKKIILVFDEIVTGFRIHKGGAQSYFKITPDLSCFGKAMGNGVPISALVGKKKYMKFFNSTIVADYIIKNTFNIEYNKKEFMWDSK